jgi:hypothetical protein
MKTKGDESKLPKWAQKRLRGLRLEIELLQSLKTAHALLSDKDRDWFTIQNICGKGEDYRYLWMLNRDSAATVCSLGKDDMIVVGRAKK